MDTFYTQENTSLLNFKYCIFEINGKYYLVDQLQWKIVILFPFLGGLFPYKANEIDQSAKEKLWKENSSAKARAFAQNNFYPTSLTSKITAGVGGIAVLFSVTTRSAANLLNIPLDVCRILVISILLLIVLLFFIRNYTCKKDVSQNFTSLQSTKIIFTPLKNKGSLTIIWFVFLAFSVLTFAMTWTIGNLGLILLTLAFLRFQIGLGLGTLGNKGGYSAKFVGK